MTLGEQFAWKAAAEKLQAENARLRAALEKISQYVSLTYCDGPSHPTAEALIAQEALRTVQIDAKDE